MTQAAWNDPAGAVLVAVFAAPQGDGVDRVAVAMNRSTRKQSSAAGAARRHGVARARRHPDPEAPERRIALADRVRLPPAPRSFSPRARRRAAALSPAAPERRDDRHARRRGRDRRRNGGTSAASARSSRPRPRSRFLTALGLEVGQRSAGARQPGRGSSTRRSAAACRFSLVLRLDEPPVAPLRDLRRRARRPDRARRRRVREWRVERRRRRPPRPARRTLRRRAADRPARRCRSAATGSLSTASNAR